MYLRLKKVYIEITNRCNLNCSFCAKSKLPKKDMSVLEFKHIIEEVKTITNNVYLHVKGEPLLHPHLQELLMICEVNKMRVNITTNATLLKKQSSLLSMFSCIKKINISLHCENNQKNYLHDVFTTCEMLKKGRTIVYRLWTMNDHTLDTKGLQIINAMQSYYSLSDIQKQETIQIQNYKISENIYVDKDNEFTWPSLQSEESSEGYCFALKTHLAILVNGDVVPCCLDGEGIVCLGNIHTQTIDCIMNSVRYQKLKLSFQKRKPCEELCQKCSFKLRLKK